MKSLISRPLLSENVCHPELLLVLHDISQDGSTNEDHVLVSFLLGGSSILILNLDSLSLSLCLP